MKKLLILLLSVALISTFASCTAEDGTVEDTQAGDTTIADTAETEDTTSEDTAEVYDAILNDAVYNITLDNGAVISVGSYSEEAVTALGTPIDMMEASSCIHEGFDKVYTFDGFSITTSPDAKGGQYLAEFTLLSDLVAFDNGLTVGSSASELSDVFGDTYDEQFGVRTYKLDSVSVSVLVDGDTVSGITVSAIKE